MKKNSRIVNIDYEKNKTSWFYFIPLLLIAGFVPLIVHGKYIDLTGTTQALYWTGQNQLLDFFSYWKSRWVIFLTATALVIYIFLLITKKLPFKKEYKYYIPLVIYAFFVILSTIFAIDVPTALNGFVDMYQGMWVLLSYVLLTFLTINFVNSERDVKLFLYAFVFLIIVEGLIGVGQYFGFDIFNTKFGNSLIIPSGINVDGGLNFNFGKHTIYGTLFNTNFVGSFATLMLPMAVVFLVSAKGWKKRIISIITLLLCMFTWIGCNSRAGYMGVGFSVLIAIVMLERYILKYWKISIGICVIGIVGFIGSNYISEGLLMNRLSVLNVFTYVENIKKQNDNKDVFKFEDIELNENIVSIKSNFQDLNIKVEEGKLYFIDGNDNILPMASTEDGLLYVDLPKQDYIRVKIAEEYSGFSISTWWVNNTGLSFYIDDDIISVLGSGGRIVKPINADVSKPFIGLESIMSERGYIWGRTIPMLDKYIFWGAGCDNFSISFPQDDFVAKLNTGMAASTVIDKPHNIYLQIAINTGVISLVALLLLWITYVFCSIKLYWKMRLDTIEKRIGMACLLSVVGYLFAALFNDHIVSVSPIFWLILGIGASINSRVKKFN